MIGQRPDMEGSEAAGPFSGRGMDGMSACLAPPLHHLFVYLFIATTAIMYLFIAAGLLLPC